jgi:DNA-binding transcriptional LysR family regulator
LKALRVGRVRRMLCASPDYLARHGVPKHPSDLAGHAVIGTTNLSPRAGWRFGDRRADLGAHEATADGNQQ